MFEGEALLRRMYRYGFLDESQTKLDYVLALTPQDVLERRLQVRWLWRWQWGWRHWQDTLDAPAVAEGL
jgi:hypothetical protein